MLCCFQSLECVAWADLLRSADQGKCQHCKLACQMQQSASHCICSPTVHQDLRLSRLRLPVAPQRLKASLSALHASFLRLHRTLRAQALSLAPLQVEPVKWDAERSRRVLSSAVAIQAPLCSREMIHAAGLAVTQGFAGSMSRCTITSRASAGWRLLTLHSASQRPVCHLAQCSASQ